MIRKKCKICGAIVKARTEAGIDKIMQFHYDRNHAN